MANRSVLDEGADDPATEKEESAGCADPSALKMSLDSFVERTPNNTAKEHIRSTHDVRGQQLDAVVARLGTAPDADLYSLHLAELRAEIEAVIGEAI